MTVRLSRVEVGILCREVDSMASFWTGVTGYKLGDLDSARVYLDLVPPGPEFPIIFLQQARDYDNGPTRIHIDLYVTQLEAAVKEAIALGGSKVGDYRTGSEGEVWQIMCDPEGNEFCFCEAEPS